MRIAWCTPFGLHSAIGRVSEIVVEELHRMPGVTVDVFHPAASGGRSWSGETRLLEPDGADVLRSYDRVVYHLGNHAPNHLDLWHASLEVPGLVVLHDVVMASLFHELLLERGDYAEEMGRWYGPEVAELTRRVLLGSGETPPWEIQGGAAQPMISLAAAGAQVAVVHSRYAEGLTDGVVLADVERLYLPVLQGPAPALGRAELGLPESVPLVLQPGLFHRNKRIDVVVEAFARLVRARPAHLVLAGRPAGLSRADLDALLRRFGVVDATVFDDPSDDVLAALRAQADIGVALRDPCLEGASYSLLESLASGLPVVTVSDGSYAEVQGPFVRHVPKPLAAADVADAMHELLDADRDSLSEQALAYVEEVHHPRVYAESLLQVIRRDPGAGPRNEMAARLGTALRDVGLGDWDEYVERTAERAAELFAGVPREWGTVDDRARSWLSSLDPTA